MFSINDIPYGVLSAEQQAHKDSSSQLFDCDVADIPLVDPPKNDSRETRSELRHMMQVRHERPLSTEFLEVADRDMTGLFSRRISANNLIPPVWVHDISMQVSVFSVHLKDHFQRPRPFQLAPVLGVDEFHPMSTETGHSPSYPSGHTMQSYVLGSLLERMFGPAYGFMDLAEDISISRIQMGVHYPSDVHYGRFVADFLLEHVRI